MGQSGQPVQLQDGPGRGRSALRGQPLWWRRGRRRLDRRAEPSHVDAAPGRPVPGPVRAGQRRPEWTAWLQPGPDQSGPRQRWPARRHRPVALPEPVHRERHQPHHRHHGAVRQAGAEPDPQRRRQGRLVRRQPAGYPAGRAAGRDDARHRRLRRQGARGRLHQRPGPGHRRHQPRLRRRQDQPRQLDRRAEEQRRQRSGGQGLAAAGGQRSVAAAGRQDAPSRRWAST